MRHLLPQEWLRFGWYFLITRRDCASGSGCARWVAKNASADHERR
jgi:rhamnopyranosyl-N-acetylglucosaminyl-diphospho-decaprenol beta-1,3/1,4-galactofuranosyltransferase